MNDWQKGPPPEVAGPWFVAYTRWGGMILVNFHPGLEEPWFEDSGDYHQSDRFAFHLPTPIHPPKESP